ncbi:MAG: threonylcarbamoyl-AMP synthase [Lewinellaceae bacterium]|nr:threonylcarbamoyl-AMP synthase [Phaeodactylibacter sp.]MCB9346571.1 threonylcarbamoyl-AMP synthase [Lewinellaceae bacterium]
MIGTDINYAIQLLKAEAVVAIPTETVYGLAGNALSPTAVSTIFEVKNRPSFDPLIIHTSRFERIADFTTDVPAPARQLARRFMPGPLTLLLPKSGNIPDIVTAGSPRVAIRIPAHSMTQELLAALEFPLAAPSANPFGYISPTTARHVADQLGDKIPYILDGGPCRVGVESTIVGFEDGQVVVYRKGGVAVEDIEAVVGPVLVRAHSTSNPEAPGMLKSHYAPSAPIVLGDTESLLSQYHGQRAGAITYRKAAPGISPERQLVLSPTGNLAEAARNLFAGMRRLDALQLDVILAELLPEEGLGRAINDRLRRAAAR